MTTSNVKPGAAAAKVAAASKAADKPAEKPAEKPTETPAAQAETPAETPKAAGGYDPGSDSTPNLNKQARELGVVMLDWSGARCLCGCRGEATGRFQPGHDAKMKGKLMRAHIAGVKVRVIDGDKGVTAPAVNVAAILSTAKYDWKKAIEEGAEAAKKRAADAARKKAATAERRELARTEKPSGKITLADLTAATEAVAETA